MGGAGGSAGAVITNASVPAIPQALTVSAKSGVPLSPGSMAAAEA